MRYICSFFAVLAVVLCVFLCPSCSTCNGPQKLEKNVNLDMADFADASSIYFDVGGKVLYALPTPIEASMLIKNWGVPKSDLLNNPANVSKYLTKRAMAVNFGVYLTDMALVALYGQPQTALQYKKTMQQLVDGLGLQAVVDQKMMKRIEDNINKKDELMQIISEMYASCTKYLSEDDRDFYALAMMSGGWVEGMFIATSMIDENQTSAENLNRMKQIVTDNKLTFDLLWTALSQMDVIPEDAVFLMLDMSYVAHLFGHQTLISTPANAEIVNIDNITPKVFAELKGHIKNLRQQFTK